MLRNLTGWHALIVLVVVLLLFGATRLPALASSVGKSLRILKSEITEPETTAPDPSRTGTPAPPSPTSGSTAAGGTVSGSPVSGDGNPGAATSATTHAIP